MFLSLHQPVTKYQTPNITRYFCCHPNLKREERAWPLLFLNCDNNKKVRLTFAVWYWFLVTSWCNERSSTLQIEGQRNLLLFYALHNCQLTILSGFTHICTHFSEIPPDFIWFLPDLLDLQVNNFQKVSFVLILIYSKGQIKSEWISKKWTKKFEGYLPTVS